MRLHPHRGWYQEAPPRGAWVRQQRGVKRCANPMRPQMSAVEAVSSELPTFSEWAMPRLARQRGLEQPSDPRADVVLVETAEPQRVHGQRPWFQNSMNNYSSLVICQVQPFRASGPGLKRPLERLNKPVQMPAIHHPHACGGNVRCTTCRVHSKAGKTERMTEVVKKVQAALDD